MTTRPELRNFDGLGRTLAWVKKYSYNPPYNNVVPWLRNSIPDWEKGVLSCALIKADTSTGWMHDLSFHTLGSFGSGDASCSAKGPAPFNSAAAVYEPGKMTPGQSIMWKDKTGVWHVLLEWGVYAPMSPLCL